MNQKRFYYNHSTVYGWCVYDRQTQMPAYDACAELLPPVSQNENGTTTESPICDTEYQAMKLCTRLNLADKKRTRVKNILEESWQDQIDKGYITVDQMVESLKDQIDGVEDLSGDELTEDMARIMGWDYDAIMDDYDRDEWNIWTDIVVEAAEEFVGKQ